MPIRQNYTKIKLLKAPTMLPVKWLDGHRVVQSKFKGRFTREQIEKYAQKFSNDLAARGVEGKISVSLLYPENWYSGYFTNFGEPIKLYHHHDSDRVEEDPDQFEEFRIYTLKK